MSQCARSRIVLGILGLLLLAPGQILADEPDSKQEPANDNAAGLAFFETNIRPVLVKRCYACHSQQAGKSEGNLLVDSRETLRAGGDRGPAIVPGDMQASLLLTAISQTDPDFKMPPRGKPLTAGEVDAFKKWIAIGAPDPREKKPGVAAGVDIAAGRAYWSMQPVVAPIVPQPRQADWAVNDIDRFVLASLEAAGLKPSPDANPATLLRRLYFDLVGLPPAPEDLARFQQKVKAAGLDQAVQLEVDALLAAPQYGERWGRHWLDVARFGESSGKEANLTFPYAWRYRDYVIDCFNDDVPYDEFLIEQIAGDLLPVVHDRERARLLIATGFLALGPKHLDEANPWQFLADVIDEQIDTVSRAVLGNSLACARCHDHKFEPYTMEDYYSVAGIFASTKTYFGTYVTPINRVGGDPLPLPRKADAAIFQSSITPEKVKSLREELAALQQEQYDGTQAVKKAIEAGEDASEIFTLRDALRIFWRSGAIEGQLEMVDEQGQALPLAMGVLDREHITDVPLLERGEIDKPGEIVPRGVPQVFDFGPRPEMPKDQSGRLQFARWLASPQHPLTARVIANRVWHYLLGSGIVRSVDNFGPGGEQPSHPQLLDHLATRLMDQGWSVKSLVREIAISRTYRQSSTYRPEAFRQDPDNRLLWRASKRRLDAESIRDAMLAAAGTLDSSRRHGSLVAEMGDRPVSLIGLDPKIPQDLDASRHRSVYLPVLRDRLPDVLELFDFAEPSLVTGERETTNVPVQALYLMNSSFVRDRAGELATRVAREAPKKRETQLKLAFELCFGRPADAADLKLAQAFFDQTPEPDSELTPAAFQQQLFIDFCQALLAAAEFRNLD